MKYFFKASCVAVLLVPVISSAVSLDFRHEYKAESKSNADRVKISHTTETGYFFSIEGRSSESTDPTSDGFREGNGDLSGNGSEWEAGRNFKSNDSLTISPGMNIDAGDTAMQYRPFVKATYKITSNWITSFRYRPGVNVPEDSNLSNKYFNQFNWVFGYKNSDFSIMGDYEYRLTNYDDYKGNHNYWLYNVTIGLPIDQHWTPYTEIGIVPQYNEEHEQDSREMRYRLGIRYSF